MARSRYTFGDSALAAARLDLLDDAFRAASTGFLRRRGPVGAALVIDLGCGTGNTTALLARELEPRRVLGLDSSARHVARARRTLTRSHTVDIEFAGHDVSLVPFPDTPAGVIYGRFLLAHLPDPEGLVALWRRLLTPGGALLLEETSEISTADPVFSRYLAVVDGLLRSIGGDLFVGRRLGYLPGVEFAEQVHVRPDPAEVARLFRMNLAEWRSTPGIGDVVTQDELSRLERGLDLRSTSDGVAGEIEWVLDQVVVRP